MKRFLALALCLIMIFSLAACSSVATVPVTTAGQTATGETPVAATGEEESPIHNIENCFSAGFAKESITPDFGVPLGGFGNSSFRVSDNVLDDIEAVCIALSDGTDTALLFTIDETALSDAMCQQIASLASKKTGVPTENIFVCATHCHSAPDPNSTEGSIASWKTILYAATTAAAEKAMADRDKAEIFGGSTQVSGLNFVRHYLLADGTYTGDGFGNPSTAAIVGHETEADNQMQILKFDRENQNDIILANFQTHPTLTSGSTRTDISADLIGVFRREVEKETKADCIYFTGASGNLNPKSKIAGESAAETYKDHGKLLCKALVDALPSLEKIESGKIASTSTTIAATVNHTTDSLAENGHAQEISSLMSSNKKAEADALCQRYGFSSVFAANSVISRAKLPATLDVTLYTLSIGNIAFIGAPYEMFDVNGLNVKTNSPFKMTVVCELTNGTFGYIPSSISYPHGGYEADTSKFIMGTAEQFEASFLTMLNTLHDAK